MPPDTPEAALAEAEREGFRLAVIGRTCALAPLAVVYLSVVTYPNHIFVAGLLLIAAAVGLGQLWLVGTGYERVGRYAFFAFDAAAVSAVLALVPLSSSGAIPQNLIFLSSRSDYYYIVVATSVLALSPALVLWTGFCAVVGLAGATAWIVAGMARVVGPRDLPPSASPDDVLALMLSPDFLNIIARLNEGVVIALVTCIAALAVHRARAMVRAHAAAEARRAQVQRIFGRYVPVQVAEQLAREGRLAPEQRDASIIFADIEGFTRLSQALPPARVIGLLNGFFSAATAIIDARGGVVVNHVGDALIAAFNAPLAVEAHPLRAVGAARALLSLVATREFDGHRLRLRIGIASGPVAAGTVGGAERQTYTLYGDAVNLAQRLEQLNKELDTSCLICGTTFEAARSDCVDAMAMGSMPMRGRDGDVEVFALGGPADAPQRPRCRARNADTRPSESA